MRRFFNNKDELVPEMIGGFIKSFSDSFYKLEGRNGVVYKPSLGKERVRIIGGSGSAGEPWGIGACGEGMADAFAVGNTFSAPSASIIDALCREVCGEEGVLCIFGNHMGDILNFELGRDLFLTDCPDKKVMLLPVTDDLGSGRAGASRAARKSLTGPVTVLTIAAAAAADGLPLEEVYGVARRANGNISSITQTLDTMTNPVTGFKMREIPRDEIHFGTGVTGEPGIRTEKFTGERAATHIALDYLIDDLCLKAGDEAALLISGCGGVTVMENLIVANTAHDYLRAKGIRILDTDVNDRNKVQDANSIALSLLKLDAELKKYYFRRACSPLTAKAHF